MLTFATAFKKLAFKFNRFSQVVTPPRSQQGGLDHEHELSCYKLFQCSNSFQNLQLKNGPIVIILISFPENKSSHAV